MVAYWRAHVQDPPQRRIVRPVRSGFESVDKWRRVLAGLNWPDTEVGDSGVDHQHFAALSDGGQQVVARILTVFSGLDAVVNESLAEAGGESAHGERLPMELTDLFVTQEAQEVVHKHVYANLLDFCLPPALATRARTEFDTNPAIAGLVEWAQRWCSSERPLAVQVAARATLEAVAFTANFMPLHELKKTGKMPSATFANDLISQDESCHAESGFDALRAAFADGIAPLDHRKDARAARAAMGGLASRIARDCYQAAVPLFEWIYEGGAELGTATLDHALAYTRLTMNKLLEPLEAPAPFPGTAQGTVMRSWIATLALSSKGRSNFFEGRSAQYSSRRSATASVWRDAQGAVGVGMAALRAAGEVGPA